MQIKFLYKYVCGNQTGNGKKKEKKKGTEKFDHQHCKNGDKKKTDRWTKEH